MIIPTLNPLGRFGHQFHNYLSAFLVSKFLGADIAPCELLGNASAWNNVIQFPASCDTCCYIQAQCAASMEGNSITKDHLKYYYTHLVSSCENASVRIPVDQWANDSLMKLLPLYQDQISSMLISRKQTSNQIALHMRRGDVSATSSTSLYMPDHRYIHAIQSLNSQYPLDWPICIYSEGSSKQFFAFAQRLRDQETLYLDYCACPFRRLSLGRHIYME